MGREILGEIPPAFPARPNFVTDATYM